MRAVSLPPGTHRFRRSFLLDEDRVRIVFAVVAALPAILLRHRCHHAARQRLALGKLHAVDERHRRIVPGGAVINFGGRSQSDTGHKLRDLLRRQWRHTFVKP